MLFYFTSKHDQFSLFASAYWLVIVDTLVACYSCLKYEKCIEFLLSCIIFSQWERVCEVLWYQCQSMLFADNLHGENEMFILFNASLQALDHAFSLVRLCKDYGKL